VNNLVSRRTAWRQSASGSAQKALIQPPMRRRPRHTIVNLVSTAVVSSSVIFGGLSASFAQSLSGILPQNSRAKSISLPQKALNQIAALEAEASSRTPAQKKLSSHLWYAAKMNAGQAVATNVPALTVGVTPSVNGYVDVDISADVTDVVLAQIEAAGGKIDSSFPKYHSIRATLPLASLEAIAGLSGIRFIKPAVYPTVQGADPVATRRTRVMRMLGQYFRPIGADHKTSSLQAHLPGLYNALNSASFNVGFTPGTGSVDSEGDTTHKAIQARANFHVDGTGIKIGVMSDSDDFLESSQASGDLGTVTVLSGQSGRPGSGEGTAMMEIVHDIVPGATIYFASSGNSEAQMATNIENLAAAGCKVIVDDIAFSDESPFQDGIIAQAVQTVTAQGVIYFSSADNFGNATDFTSSAWQNNFIDSGSSITTTGGGKIAAVTIQNGTTYIVNAITDRGGGGQNPILFWNDPLGHSSNDYNLFILDPSGSTIVGASTDVQSGTQDPVEFVGGVPDGYLVVVVQHSGAARFLHMDLASQNGLLSWFTPGRTRGHATVNAVGAYGVAATPAAVASTNYNKPTGPYPNAFNTTNQIEYFSSDGPSHLYYNTDGTAITPSDLTASGGLFVQKPDITAADGVTTSLSAAVTGPNENFAPFFGTSAAAPHAAALTALLLSYNPTLSQTQVRTLLTSTAIDIMAAGADRDSGAGIIDAQALLAAAPSIAPSITSFTPTSGGIGISVTITGTNFTGATAVKFHGTAATFSVVNATTITATVPAAATTGTITVTTPKGTATSAASFTVTVSAPTITSFTPTNGPIGTSVTITGTNLTGASAVKFNGTAAATFSAVNATTVTATVPTGATTGTIAVTTPGGTATSAANFTVTSGGPTVTSFSPTSGPAGTTVTISGTNFTGATAVAFHGTASSSFTIVSAVKITAVVPAGATTGTIAVTTPSGTGTSTASFTVTIPAPAITSFTPASGPVGTSVTITGTGFTSATAVKFHGTVATFTVVSATSITATVPAAAATGTITVTTPSGTATSAASFTVTVAAPTITTFQPASGPIGTSVIIAGTNFTGATAVKFNNKPATAFTINSAQFITATVPAGATTGKIAITAPGGTATSTANFTVTASAPTVTSFSPASGPVGTKITVMGTNLTGATAVKVNGFACTSIVVASSTSLTAIVPTGATTGNISVTTPGGLAYSSTAFVVTLPVPTVTTFSPTSGYAGKVITVKGTNLTGATSVTFNGVASTSITAVTATSLSAAVPAGATTGPIAVTTPGGTGTSTANFTVTAGPPTIVTFQPQSGPVGTKVIIAGTNFTGATAVTFNGKAAALITVNSDQLITAPVPAGATTGFISVKTPVGTATSTVKFTVTP